VSRRELVLTSGLAGLDMEALLWGIPLLIGVGVGSGAGAGAGAGATSGAVKA